MAAIPPYDPFTKAFNPRPHRKPKEESIAPAIGRALEAAYAVIEGIAEERRISPDDESEHDIAAQILHNKNVSKWEAWEKLFVKEAAFDYVDLRRHVARQIINGADHRKACKEYGVEHGEMDEHLEFMRPYVQGEHITAAAIAVRQGRDAAEVCEEQGVTAAELAHGLTYVLKV